MATIEKEVLNQPNMKAIAAPTLAEAVGKRDRLNQDNWALLWSGGAEP